MFWSKKDPSELGLELKNSYLYGRSMSKEKYVDDKGKELLIELKLATDMGRHCIIISIDSPKLLDIEHDIAVYFKERNVYFNPMDIEIPGFGIKHHWYLSVLTNQSENETE